MKNLSLLVWLSQLGLSVVAPLAGFILIGVWVHMQFNLGVWVIILGSIVGICCAVTGFCNSLKTMNRLASNETNDKPPVSFNEHE